MLKKTYTYVDYNGTERTDTNWFNLTQAEMLEMELTTKNGLTNMVQEIIKSNDAKEIVRIFKDIILKSYGIKSQDGRRFIKTEELKKEFEQTEFYSKLFVELATDADAAAAFINGIVEDNIANNSEDLISNKIALSNGSE